MVCLHCNLSLSRAEVGIIGEPPVRIRDRVWTACYRYVSDTVHVKKMSVNNVYINFKNNIERVRKHSITNTDVWYLWAGLEPGKIVPLPPLE